MAAVFLAALAVLAFLPRPWKGRLATHGYLHLCAHMVAFGAAFLLIAWTMRDRASQSGSAILLLLFGVVLEVFQTRVYGNLLEYRDIAANGTGIVLAFLACNIWKDQNGQR
jgi:hypothetical protein